MRIILTIILSLTFLTGFSQRWLRQKFTNIYVADSSGTLVTGNLAAIGNWVRDHMSIEDTARFEVVTVLNPGYGKMIFINEEDNENPVDLTGHTTNRINRLRRPRPGMIRYDRTVDKVRVYTPTGWKYLLFE